MEQKYYKIHNTNLYILEGFDGDINIENVIEDIEEIVDDHFLEGLETLIVSPYPEQGRIIEGDTIYLRNDYHCDELFIEEILISVGEFNFLNLIGEDKEDLKQFFLTKRAKMFQELREKYNQKVSLYEFMESKEDKLYVDNLNNLEFEDMILLTQKYFGTYESSLSLRNYISNSFHLYVTESLNKKYDKKISKLFENLKEEST